MSDLFGAIFLVNFGFCLCSQQSAISPTSTGIVSPSSSVLVTESKTKDLNQLLKDNTTSSINQTFVSSCPDNTPCNRLGASCIQCSYNDSCVYGRETEVNCTAHATIKCTGSRTFVQKFNCRYCYQTKKKDHVCMNRTDCKVMSSPLSKYITNCTVNENILCLGNRTFRKMAECNWTSGYRWSTTVLLSLTLGGFGVDRFYLGHWKEGLGKLFSFGGLGVWTLVDLILIFIGYVGPADGSLYIF